MPERQMQLTPGQLAPLWPLLDAAWRAHCAGTGAAPGDGKAREEFRHAQIHAALGVRSLKMVKRSGDQYVRLMAHLEVLAGDGIHWQMRLGGAAIRPLVHAIMDLIDARGIDEHYVCAIARQQLQVAEMPALDKMTAPQLLNLLQILRCKTRSEPEGAAA